MRARSRFFTLPFLFLTFAAHFANAEPSSDAVTTERSTSRLIAASETVSPGSELWVAWQIDLQPGWHTYWQNAGDSGLPVSVAFTVPQGVKAGEIQWPVPEIIDTSGIMSYGYGGTSTLPAKITIPQDIDKNSSKITISAKVNWLVCKDICIPESGNYTLTLPIKPGDQVATSSLFNKIEKNLPVASDAVATYTADEKEVHLTIEAKDDLADESPLAFYPITDGIIKNGAPLKSAHQDGQFLFAYPAGSVTDGRELKGLLVTENNQHKKGYYVTLKSTSAASAATTDPSPAPSATSTSSVDTTPSPTPAEDNNLTFLGAVALALLGGIVLNLMPCVLPVLSLKLFSILKKSGEDRGLVARHGVAYTAGVMLSFMGIAGLLIALRLSGAEIGWGFQLQSTGFLLAMAIIMLLVALNLMGLFQLPVLFGTHGYRFTSKESPAGSFFTGVLATLVATPCTAPFMAPAIGFALTQPPISALIIFEALGFGMALPFLLISLLPELRGLLPKPGAWMNTFKEFLAFPMLLTLAWLLWVITLQAGPRALIITLCVLLLTTFALWCMTRTNWKIRKCIALLALLIAGYMTSGLPSQGGAVEIKEGEQPFSMKSLEKLKASHSPVFVNATAAWCLTCKLNEISTLSSSSLKQYFAQEGIVYMVADWTNRDEEISKYLASFQREGVPMYVYYPSDGGMPQLLPQVLSPSLVKDTIEKAEHRVAE